MIVWMKKISTLHFEKIKETRVRCKLHGVSKETEKLSIYFGAVVSEIKVNFTKN